MAIRLPRIEKELAEVKEQLANARKTSDAEKARLVKTCVSLSCLGTVTTSKTPS